MIKINKKLWSLIGARGTFGQAIYEFAKVRQDFVVLTADVGNSSGLKKFIDEMPNRYLNVGIAEQNLVSVAAGIAKEGITVFAASFSPFISMRACEQIRINVAYMNTNVKLVGIGSGVSLSYLGNSHYGLEDAGVMRAIPNMTVVTPADGVEIAKTVEAALDYEGPMYIRLTGGTRNPIVYNEDYDFEIGKGIRLAEGNDVLMIANGTMVYQSLQAAKLLAEQNIGCTVINMHTVKPLDKAIILDNLDGKKLIVTVEEHVTNCGLGSAVAEELAVLNNKPRQVMIGLPNSFIKSASYNELLNHFGLTAEAIADRVRKN